MQQQPLYRKSGVAGADAVEGPPVRHVLGLCQEHLSSNARGSYRCMRGHIELSFRSENLNTSQEHKVLTTGTAISPCSDVVRPSNFFPDRQVDPIVRRGTGGLNEPLQWAPLLYMERYLLSAIDNLKHHDRSWLLTRQ